MINQGFSNMTPNMMPHSERLRENTAPVKISFTWFGARKAIADVHKEEIAEKYGAQAKRISASKKLLEKHPALKELQRIKGEITRYWKDNTLPFPEDGIRLLRKNRLEEFQYQIQVYKNDLVEAVRNLDDARWEIMEIAKQELGELYDPDDYPDTFAGRFSVEASYPNITIPEYLAEMAPEAYEAEKQRVAQQFELAVRETEQEFCKQFENLLSHLADRLTPDPVTGEAKTFKAASLDNLNEFFERFKSLSIGSNDRLDTLVSEAQDIVSGLNPKALRSNVTLRESIAANLASVRDTLDTMIIDRPRRRIIRDVPVLPDGSSDDPAIDPESN
jgi:hypothetical protein